MAGLIDQIVRARLGAKRDMFEERLGITSKQNAADRGLIRQEESAAARDAEQLTKARIDQQRGGVQGPFRAGLLDDQNTLLSLDEQTIGDQNATLAGLAQEPALAGQVAPFIQSQRPEVQQALAAAQQQEQQAREAAQVEADFIAQQRFDTAARGGLSVTEHTKRTDQIFELGTGIDNWEDLRTLNREFGREVLPGEVKALYEAMRFNGLQEIRRSTEAGALQKAEIDLFSQQIPAWGVFNAMTPEGRDAKLREAQRVSILKRQGLIETTAGAEDPGVRGRTVDEMLGNPEAPAGFERVPSTIGAETLDRLNPLSQVPEGTFPGLLDFVGNIGGGR